MGRFHIEIRRNCSEGSSRVLTWKSQNIPFSATEVLGTYLHWVGLEPRHCWLKWLLDEWNYELNTWIENNILVYKYIYIYIYIYNQNFTESRIYYLGAQSLATNSPAPGLHPLTCGISSECLGTRSYETTSRDQRGKLQMFFSSTGACTATKSPIANHRSSIVAQPYFASVTQMFLMPLFVEVESGSRKLLRTVSKSGPNGCKERSRPQKMLMGINIESFEGR